MKKYDLNKKNPAQFIKTLLIKGHYNPSIILFMRSILVWQFVNTLSLFEFAHEHWSNESIVMTFGVKPSFLTLLFGVMSLGEINQYYFAFLIIRLFVILLAFWKPQLYLPRIIMFYIVCNMTLAANPLFNGADKFNNILLTFFMLLNPNSAETIEDLENQPIKDYTLSLISYFSVFLIKFHLLIIYFSTFFFKMISPAWSAGVAVFYVLNSDYFGHPMVRNSWFLTPAIVYLSNYSILIFQSIFPFMVWIKKFKAPLLLLGLTFHATTVVLMGLMNFTLVPICYLTFFENNWTDQILAKTDDLKRLIMKSMRKE
jgi:hypothetical protein